jgi:hypothetical protein
MNRTAGSNMGATLVGQEGRDDKYWRRKYDDA